MCLSAPPVDEVALQEYQEYIEATLERRVPDKIYFGCELHGWEGLSNAQLHRLICALNASSNVRSIILYGSGFAFGNGATFDEFVQALQRHSRLEKIILNGNLCCVALIKRTLCVSDCALQIAEFKCMLQFYLRWSA